MHPIFFIYITFHLLLYYLVSIFHEYFSVLMTLDKPLLGYLNPFLDHLQISRTEQILTNLSVGYH